MLSGERMPSVPMSSGYSANHIRHARTFLFVPGNRPERFVKAASAQPDILVIDLEDAVAPIDKNSAREHVRDWLLGGNAAMVRINGADTPWHMADRVLIEEFAVRSCPRRPKLLRRFANSPIWRLAS